MKNPSPELQSFAQASSRVAAELRGLQDRVERLEDTLEGLYRDPEVSLDAHTIGTLQDVDFLLQSITALSAYLDRLASNACSEGRVCVRDALEAVPLRDMAARLRGSETRDTGHESQHHTELF